MISLKSVVEKASIRTESEKSIINLEGLNPYGIKIALKKGSIDAIQIGKYYKILNSENAFLPFENFVTEFKMVLYHEKGKFGIEFLGKNKDDTKYIERFSSDRIDSCMIIGIFNGSSAIILIKNSADIVDAINSIVKKE